MLIGYVNIPGIYEIKKKDRINTAVEKAGGFKKGYSIKNINLASKLEDGDKIYIPSIEEDKQNSSLNTSNNIEKRTGIIRSEKSLDSTNKENTGKININKASQSELKQINGVGDSTANKIIDYRENVGKFKKIEDIKEVKGIGDAKFEAIKNRITI